MANVWRCSIRRLALVAIVTGSLGFFLLVTSINQDYYRNHIRLRSREELDRKSAALNSFYRKGTPPSMDQVKGDRKRIIHSPPMPKSGSSSYWMLKTVPGLDIALFSAVVGNSSVTATWDQIVLTGWQNKALLNASFDCCIRYGESALVRAPVRRVNHWGYLGRAKMEAKQYVCPNVRPNEKIRPTGVTLTNGSCNAKPDWLIKPSFAYHQTSSKIAICVKIAYGNLNASDLIEWFEFHRFMGVDKILLHTHMLNPHAKSVLKYYNSIGLAEFSKFEVPISGKNGKPEVVGRKSMQSFNDEQIPVYDCLEKLKGYKYVAIFDPDEFMMPARGQKWKQFLDSKFRKRPFGAGITFPVEVFVTSWGTTNKDGRFKVTRYLNRTGAMRDRVKNIFRPERLVPGGAETHNYFPDFKRGYKRLYCPASEAVIKHYRPCRSSWTKSGSAFQCWQANRTTDRSMEGVMKEIGPQILAVQNRLFGR